MASADITIVFVSVLVNLRDPRPAGLSDRDCYTAIPPGACGPALGKSVVFLLIPSQTQIAFSKGLSLYVAGFSIQTGIADGKRMIIIYY